MAGSFMTLAFTGTLYEIHGAAVVPHVREGPGPLCLGPSVLGLLSPSYLRILITTYMPVAAWSAVAPKGLTRMVNFWFAAALLGTWRL